MWPDTCSQGFLQLCPMIYPATSVPERFDPKFEQALKCFYVLLLLVARSTFSSQNVQTHQLRTTFGSWDVEKVHAVVARSTFRSQNVQNTSVSDHFWKFRSRKSARRCGAKHIEVKMLKTLGVRTTFGGSDAASLRFGSLHYTIHSTTLHYSTLHYTTLHNTTTTTTELQNYTTTLHYTPLRSTTLNYTTLHHLTLHSTTLHYITLHYTPPHYNYNYDYTSTLHYAPLH